MLTSFLGALVLALHLAGVLAAMHAVMNTRTPQGAFAWALGLVFLPYVTLIPYLYLGRSRFLGYIDLHRARRGQMQALAEVQLAHGDDAADVSERYDEIARMLGARFHTGQRLELLVNGEATFDAILAAIGEAKRCVLVQFFIIHDDALGQRMQQALLDRVRAGVDVCVLYDGIGSHALPASYADTLREAGVHIHPFATQRRSHRFQLNFRNHRKIVVVDGTRGFVGGLNVGDEYLGLKPPLAPWRDTHLAIEGPAVADLQRSFAEDWHWVTGELPPLLKPSPGGGTAHTLVVATGPADRQETCSLFFVAMIHAARRRLWITTPYFVPDQAVMSALRLAVFRGVDVRVLIPARPDHTTVFLATGLYAHDAVRAGIRVFRYQPGFLHQKVLLVDEDTASVGSMNLDNRSFRLNFEIGALNVDARFAAQVEAMLADDFAHAHEVSEAEYEKAPYMKRLAMHVARLFDPVL